MSTEKCLSKSLPRIKKQCKYTLQMASACLLNFLNFPIDMRSALFVGLFAGYFVIFPFLSSFSSHQEKVLKNEISGKSVLVTGASYGIGEQLAYSYAKRGAKLLITARSYGLLKKVGKRCEKLGAGSVDIVVADMGESEDIYIVSRTAKSLFSNNLDYLVLNHAKQNKAANWLGSSLNMSSLREVFDVNYFAYVQMASLFLPLMEENAGRIVVVSSFVGHYPFPFFVPYVSSKFALEGFFGGLRHELSMRKSRITITTAVLGRIDTPGQKRVMKDGGFIRHESLPGAASPEKTAEAILEGSVYRKKAVYYPVIRPLLMVANFPLISDLMDWFVEFKMERYPDAL